MSLIYALAASLAISLYVWLPASVRPPHVGFQSLPSYAREETGICR